MDAVGWADWGLGGEGSREGGRKVGENEHLLRDSHSPHFPPRDLTSSHSFFSVFRKRGNFSRALFLSRVAIIALEKGGEGKGAHSILLAPTLISDFVKRRRSWRDALPSFASSSYSAG